MILYPTETLYALGVNALDFQELKKLKVLKNRDENKPVSWLVRDVDDIRRYAEVSPLAEAIVSLFLPGSLTLILKAKAGVHDDVISRDRTIGFRISSDPIAGKLISEYMEKYETPLTCTSANVSGKPTPQTIREILQQFGHNADMITEIVDGGPRNGRASTVVQIFGEKVSVLREGEISEDQIRKAL